MTSSTRAAGIRERNRIELTAEILASARRHLVAHGAAALSLRAITRDLGMASSAIYRYFASRDELLTALIIEAYDDLADRVQVAESAVEDRDDHRRRWSAIGNALRGWALANPQRWALIYGTPVAGYAAPEATIDSASRVTRPMLALLGDTSRSASGGDPSAPATRSQPQMLSPQLADTLSAMGVDEGGRDVVVGLGAWAQLMGLINLELFGHLNNVVDDLDAHFEHQIGEMAERIVRSPARPENMGPLSS
ncbi:MAG: TetR/AcrR family transcriptional regulator [Acidimicrobiales bacterium]